MGNELRHHLNKLYLQLVALLILLNIFVIIGSIAFYRIYLNSTAELSIRQAERFFQRGDSREGTQSVWKAIRQKVNCIRFQNDLNPLENFSLPPMTNCDEGFLRILNLDVTTSSGIENSAFTG